MTDRPALGGIAGAAVGIASTVATAIGSVETDYLTSGAFIGPNRFIVLVSPQWSVVGALLTAAVVLALLFVSRVFVGSARRVFWIVFSVVVIVAIGVSAVVSAGTPFRPDSDPALLVRAEPGQSPLALFLALVGVTFAVHRAPERSLGIARHGGGSGVPSKGHERITT